MDIRRTIQQAARAAVGALAAVTMLANSPSLVEPTPVKDLAGGVRLHEPSQPRAEMVEWALKRYRAAGLQVPPVDIYFHGDAAGCNGNVGFTRNGRVDLCVRLAMEAGPQRIVLHELAHAWSDVALDAGTRERFLGLRALTGWNVSSTDWSDRGTEQAAEIIAWGLGDGTMMPVGISGENDPAALTEGFRLLTGSDPLHDAS